jgi:hypothetical protein
LKASPAVDDEALEHFVTKPPPGILLEQLGLAEVVAVAAIEVAGRTNGLHRGVKRALHSRSPLPDL